MVTKKFFFLTPFLSIFLLIAFTAKVSACSIAPPTVNIDFNLPVNIVESKSYHVSGKKLIINEYKIDGIEDAWKKLQTATNNYLPPFDDTKPLIENWLDQNTIYSLDIHKYSSERETLLRKNNSNPFNCVYPVYSHQGDWLITSYKERPYCVTVGAPGMCGDEVVHPFLYLRYLIFKK
jgi:hypothetical protein